jgi:23S rRNA (uracil1939-C5)-methyltransferase
VSWCSLWLVVKIGLFSESTVAIGIIESLDYEARGIARLDGKTVFVDGALPGETVEYASFRKKSNYELANLIRVINPSTARVAPKCQHFGVCGGCAMQHMDVSAQVASKQRVLEDSLWHIGRVRPEQIFSPIHGTPWGYRHRARLGVRFVEQTGEVLIGFHERRSSYIADIRTCEVLTPQVSALLMPLRELLAKLSIARRIPQIEVAVGEQCTAFSLRILEPLNKKDEGLLKVFADENQVVFYLQPKGPDSVVRFYPLEGPSLSYLLPEFGVEFEFKPTDFTQVNHAVNRVMVHRALRLLEPKPGERIADMFCGLGNFTLPIARSGAAVLGVEGSEALVQRGRCGALANGLGEQTSFEVANLFECSEESLAALGHFDKMLIDPPREGALALVKALSGKLPQRIVYVSCNPATLARDSAVLVSEKGYRFVSAGAINMFPHTSHVESIAVFER